MMAMIKAQRRSYCHDPRGYDQLRVDLIPVRIFFMAALPAIPDDHPVAHLDGSAGDGCRFRVVGDHDNRLMKFTIEFLKHVEDELGVFRVEVPGRFIGQDDRRAIDDRTGDGDPLLFST